MAHMLYSTFSAFINQYPVNHVAIDVVHLETAMSTCELPFFKAGVSYEVAFSRDIN